MDPSQNSNIGNFQQTSNTINQSTTPNTSANFISSPSLHLSHLSLPTTPLGKMLTNGSHEYDHPLKFNKMKENDNLLSKHLSRGSINEKSFRVLYYGKSCGAVPFMWESQPGTPKSDMHPSSLTHFSPPLTPPPSYLTPDTPKTPKKNQPNTKSSQKKPSKGGDNFVISSIFPRKIASLKTLVSSSSKSSSNSTDSISSPSSMRLIEHFELEDDIYKCPTSTLCFGFNKQGFLLKDVRNRRARKNFKFSL